MLSLSELSIRSLKSVSLKKVNKSPERFQETSDENSGKCQSKLEKKFVSVVTSNGENDDDGDRDENDDAGDEGVNGGDDDEAEEEDNDGSGGGNNIDDGDEKDSASATTSDDVRDGNDDSDDDGDNDGCEENDVSSGNDLSKYDFEVLTSNSWGEVYGLDSLSEPWLFFTSGSFLESSLDSEERCGVGDDSKWDVNGVVFGMFSDAEPTLWSPDGGMLSASSLGSISP